MTVRQAAERFSSLSYLGDEEVLHVFRTLVGNVYIGAKNDDFYRLDLHHMAEGFIQFDPFLKKNEYESKIAELRKEPTNEELS